MKDPAFLFYTKDFQSGTQDMSCEELGAYLRLLMYQHQNDKIPNDIERLMRITGIFTMEKFDTIWKILSKKFKENGDHLVNQRLDQEINQRLTAKPKKIASACLAGLISTSKINKNDQIYLKQNFKMDHFIYDNSFLIMDETIIKSSIREWFNKEIELLKNKKTVVDQMVDNLAIANAIAIETKDIIIVNKEKRGMGKKTKQIPSEFEFLNFCSEMFLQNPNLGFFDEFKFSLKSKYESWIENKWRDGNGVEIKNWKTKVKNVVPFLKPTKGKQEEPTIGRMTMSVAEKNFRTFANVKIPND